MSDAARAGANRTEDINICLEEQTNEPDRANRKERTDCGRHFTFALCFHTMRIDQMYAQYCQDTITHRVFIDTYQSLFRKGVLSYDENGKTIKGPNWTPPAFMTDKRYD